MVRSKRLICVDAVSRLHTWTIAISTKIRLPIKIDYLYALNSRQSDFSPMYYKNGLVFVSAREEGGAIKRVFSCKTKRLFSIYSCFPILPKLRKDNIVAMKQASGVGGGSSFSASEKLEAMATEEKDKPLSKIEQFSKTLNSKYHEGPVTFFQGLQKVSFSQENNYNKGRSRTSSDGVNKIKTLHGCGKR